MRRWLAWSLLATALVVVVAMRALGRLDDPPQPFNDPAIRNITTVLAMLVFITTGWIWFCFHSRVSRRIRWTAAIVSLLIFAGFVSLVAVLRAQRVLGFSGSLVPRIASTAREPPEPTQLNRTGKADFSRTSQDDFPQFLGPQRDGSVTGQELARDWQSMPPRRVWRRPVGAGWSGFAAVNGFAVTMEQRGDQECVVCYEVATGQPVWSHGVTARHDTALGGAGPRSTPTIHEGYVYALGATGILQCLDERGHLVWSDDLRKRYNLSAADDEQNVMFGRAASPLIVDNLVIVPGGGPQGRAKNLVALDRVTGHLEWESECKLPDGKADQIAYASPTLATLAGREQVLIVNETTASGHDPQTGQLLWSHPWPGRSNGNASVSQATVAGDNRVLLSKGYSEGAELLELSPSESGLLTATRVWKVSRVLQTKFSNVVVHADHAYGLSEGIMECVALDNGRRRWKNGRYGHGQILAVNDLLLVLAEDGELHLLEMNPKRFVHLGSVQAIEGKSWNTLCIAGKRLLVRNSEEAACFELP